MWRWAPPRRARSKGRPHGESPPAESFPHGADAVVPIEDARLAGTLFTVAAPLIAGENVVERGADMRRGEIVIGARRRIRAAEIGVLATLGVTTVPVYRRPTIAVFSSGDELVDPACRPKPGEVRDSNRLCRRGVAARHGCAAAPLSDVA